ncbi:MAG: hypothetical protein U1E59_09365 [Amaricoccus sp.]
MPLGYSGSAVSEPTIDYALVTYVSGYWRLPLNAKRPLQHYLEQMPLSLAMIAGQPLRFFYDDTEVLEAIAPICAALAVNLRAERVPIDALPALADADAFLHTCRAITPSTVGAHHSEKGYIHHHRDFLGSGDATYRDLLAIWLSKIALTARVAADVHDSAAYVAWMDVSVARCNGVRSNWDFPRQTFAPSALNHYATTMRYRGARLPLSASFMAAAPAVWPEVARAFEAQLLACRTDAYAHDEETVLGLVHRQRPELFHTLGLPNRLLEPAPHLHTRVVRALKRRLAGTAGTFGGSSRHDAP